MGLTKREHLNLEFNQITLSCMKWLKEFFDPSGIFNPDKNILKKVQ
ncbi:MAG: hypothetical protein DRP47_02915 [Candidatus Zixiibacteriota bacterium]|nr:MAG: hypothetical protein DRP47_02915 [candidate division Zixibacteria bacterium]